MNELLLSFVVFAFVPAFFQLAFWLVARFGFGKKLPTFREGSQSVFITSTISIVITLVICWIMSLAGFTDAQFYRPSQRNYGQIEELGLSPEEVDFKSADGTSLHGWFFPAKGESSLGTVIHLHGSDRNITYTILNSHWLIERNFNLFVFDYRGYGKSSGKPSREGLIQDALAAIQTIQAREDTAESPIWLWGQSMGGQLAIVTAAELEGQGLSGVISEATYSTFSEHVCDKMSKMGPLWLVQWGLWLLTSDAHSAIRSVGQLTEVPLLLIHGDADRAVAPYHSDRLFEKAEGPKEIWKVPGAGHLKVFQKEEYQDRLELFLTESIKN